MMEFQFSIGLNENVKQQYGNLDFKCECVQSTLTNQVCILVLMTSIYVSQNHDEFLPRSVGILLIDN